ncbi:MAG: cupin domain-containing protein [Chloroflexi bacterium]|nr:cupin domain-containing protein [Chloroflexota bacterium]
MRNLTPITDHPLLAVWGDSVRARRIVGERITFAVVEMAPGADVPEHHHPAEQLGMVIEGQVDFRIGDETRTMGPGGTWRIESEVPHQVKAGPDGAVVVDVFSPPRADWDGLPMVEDSTPRWPRVE